MTLTKSAFLGITCAALLGACGGDGDGGPQAQLCTGFTYSAFGACQPDGTQTRTVESATPAGCAGGQPVLSQACDFAQTVCAAVVSACGTSGSPQWPGADAAAQTTACTTDATTKYKWAAGAAGATNGNTLSCRLTHAGLAASSGNTAVHCPHAGPTGGNACGSWCDNYCDLNVANCTGGNANFADRATCMTECAAAAFATTGAVNATSGNTVQCRIWHLAQAAGNPGVHCPHGRIVSVTSGGTAGPCN